MFRSNLNSPLCDPICRLTDPRCRRARHNATGYRSAVTGAVNPGEVLAIMGSSGAGKTSLLNMLAGRLPRNAKTSVKGDIKIDGAPRNWDQFNSFSA